MNRNSIWVTRTEIGYCARYKTPQIDDYLTPRENKPFKRDQAGYVTFPKLIQKIAGLPREFFQRGVELQVDENAQLTIQEEERDALVDIVRKLEGFAKDVLVRDKKIARARASLDLSID
jgi:hypothetical protein